MKRPTHTLVEALETRALFSSVGGGTVDWDGMKHLTVKGRPGPDDIQVTCFEAYDTHGEYHRQFSVRINGAYKTVESIFVYNIDIDGGGGDDKITISNLPDGEFVNVNTAGYGNTHSLFHAEQLLADEVHYTGSGGDRLEYENNGERSYDDIALTDRTIEVGGYKRVQFTGVYYVGYEGTYTNETIKVKKIAPASSSR